MPELEVVVLGVGDAFSEINHPSALLLRSDGFSLAIDCPDMYRAVLRGASLGSGQELSLSEIDHVLITHLHGDHINGLEGVAFYKRFVEGKRVVLITDPEVRAVLWEHRLKASMGTLWDGQERQAQSFESYFEHIALSDQAAIEIGPFRIRARHTRHHLRTSAIFVEAGGRSLGYSSDTSFDPALIEFLAPADLIIHETNLGPAHTPYAALAALPEALRARMRLIHYHDDFDKTSSAIAVLTEGAVLWP